MPSRLKSLPPEALARRTPPGALLVDFDGTLAPLRRDPGAVRASQAVRRTLARLAAGRLVAIISGRPLAFLRDRLAGTGVLCIGSHGAECDDPRVCLAAPPAVPAAAASAFEAARREHLRVERKPHGRVVHFRELEAAARLPAMRRWLARLAPAAPRGWEVREGNLVIELRPAGFDKGRVVPPLRALAGHVAAALGDDLTDEDMFTALAPGELGVLVGPARRTAATFRLAGPGAVGRYLAALPR